MYIHKQAVCTPNAPDSAQQLLEASGMPPPDRDYINQCHLSGGKQKPFRILTVIVLSREQGVALRLFGTACGVIRMVSGNQCFASTRRLGHSDLSWRS